MLWKQNHRWQLFRVFPNFVKEGCFLNIFFLPDSSLNFGSSAAVRIFSGNSLRYSLTRLATASASNSWRLTDFPSKKKTSLS